MSRKTKEGSFLGMNWADITKAVTGKHWQHLTDREERELMDVVSLSGNLAEAKDLWKRLTTKEAGAERKLP